MFKVAKICDGLLSAPHMPHLTLRHLATTTGNNSMS